jgi:hypothetical protein
VRVGVVGHRSLPTQVAAFAERISAHLIADLQRSSGRLAAVSALAEGADTLFAAIAVTHNVPLEAVQPHDEYLADFRTRAARAEYARLWAAARQRTVLGYRRPSDYAYAAAMRWVVDRSDLLVAFWDGLPTTFLGGTAQTVAYASAAACPVIHVHSEKEAVSLA